MGEKGELISLYQTQLKRNGRYSHYLLFPAKAVKKVKSILGDIVRKDSIIVEIRRDPENPKVILITVKPAE